MAEWFKAPVLKTGRGFRSLVGSNPTPSAKNSPTRVARFAEKSDRPDRERMGRCEQAALAEAKAYTSRQAVERDIDRGRPIRVAVLSDCLSPAIGC